MPQPTVRGVHVDAVLTNMSIAYMQNSGLFVAQRVFPGVPVSKKSDLYYRFTKNDWFRDEAKPRGTSQESAGGGYNLATDSYTCITYAFHKDVDDDIRKNSDSVLSPDRNATNFVTRRMLLRMEKQWATDYFKSGVWGTDYTGVNGAPTLASQFTRWDDYTASDPISDIERGKRAILAVTGYMPNKMVVGYDVFIKLQHHPDIVDRYKYTSSQVITEDMLARLFGVDELIVAKAIIATNTEGDAEAYDFIYGKHVLLCYTTSAPALEEPSAGYVFLWRGISDSLGQPVGMRRFRMEQLKSDRIEGEISFTNKVVATDMAVFYNGAVN